VTIKNMAASVRQRLLKLARRRQEDFNYLLTRYASERLLYRLARSPRAGQFVLKGARLFELWTEIPHRATRDIDLLGHGDNDVSLMVETFRDLCSLAVEDDGLRFLPETVVGQRIREDQEYEGIRVQLTARLERARIRVQVDVGFGDVITPPPVEVDYPTLLPFSAPRIRAYPRETVIAEKFQALVGLGMANSRMKDLFDLDAMARALAFEGDLLGRAIAATFARRRTAVSGDPPVALTDRFTGDAGKQTQWRAFLGRGQLRGDDLSEIAARLAAFLMPVAGALDRGEPFDRRWPPAGPWLSSPGA